MKREKNLRQRLTPVFFLSTGVPLLILSILSVARLDSNMQTRYEDRTSAGLSKSMECMNLLLDKYESILFDLSTNDEMIEAAEMISQHEDTLELNSSVIRSEFSHISSRTKGITGIALFTEGGQVVFYDALAGSSVSSSWIESSFHIGREGLQSYGADKEPVLFGGEELYMFHIARQVVDYRDTSKALGTLVLSLDTRVLQDAVAGDGDNEIYISEAGVIVSAPDESLIGTLEKELHTKNVYRKESIHQETGWMLTARYSLDSYKKIMSEQISFLLIIVCSVFAILVLLVRTLTNPILYSLNQVVDAMNEAETGDFSVRVRTDPSMPTEVNRIASGFNEMVERIDRLIQQKRDAVIEQKNAELSALEAQIDPHFLYNTLDTINWKAIENDQMEISEMVGALSDILRYAVKNAGEEITVRKELYWLSQYILLQQVKLGQEVKLTTEVPEHIKNFYIHKLLLQPFAENGIKYGFKGGQQDCRILVRMSEEDRWLHIVVEDNGQGMSEETLTKLNDGDLEVGGHMGIDNIRKRLKLYYSEEASLWFESERGNFSRVHMYIPIEKACCENSER